MFRAKSEDTENRLIYEIGDGQWDIPSLRKLLGEVLSKNRSFKGYEMRHDFPFIGQKVMVLNAHKLDLKNEIGHGPLEEHPSIIVLAMEDVTEMMVVAETLADHATELQERTAQTLAKLGVRIQRLEEKLVINVKDMVQK
jgi:hypothetical protein